MMIVENENERLAAVDQYQLMGTAAERDFDEITALAAQICGMPIALVTLLGKEKQWFKSHHGTALQETDRDIAFCNHAIQDQNGIMVVTDARQDERFRNNPLVTGDHKIVFYAGVPLVNPEGYALGTLCVLGHGQCELNSSQIIALRTLGRQALMLMEMRLKTRLLEQQNLELARTNAALQEFAKRAVHDLKNPLTSIILNSQALTYRLRDKVEERTLRLAEMNVSSGKELAAMINQLLEEALTANHHS
ncbi:sensor histidine kinase/GAF domain hybrid protein [Pedobacter sp. BAL39]|uniref:GAF domain-containing protein n=1 Tax=Pedobacter sp. BAL39 TaxID=391596 RepID=UPI00015593CA|nr:GAF domain-containing protein [Pedobacter sp. BAL39]EDM37985.1 sensor histidine kinase/GAF domain hybrid protein [Pedobacter sp. BAL39]